MRVESEKLRAEERWQHTYHPTHDASQKTKKEMNESRKLEPTENPRRAYEKNYSDIFAAGEGGEQAEAQLKPHRVKQREEAVGTAACSW